MPVMGGLEAARRIRRLPMHLTTPIAALTADHSAEQDMRLYEAGFTKFLCKPLTSQDLKAVASLARGGGGA